MALDLKNIANHHWLLPPGEKIFHAYVNVRQGERAVCQLSPPIAKLQEMDVPGDRSPCCIHCFQNLYGFDPLFVEKEKS